MATELKPCPFCGGEADLDSPAGSGKERLLYCKSCFASICEDSTPDVVAAWNRRAIEQAAPVAPPPHTIRPPSLGIALNMCREANSEAKLPTPMCWDLALYVHRLEADLTTYRNATALMLAAPALPSPAEPAPSYPTDVEAYAAWFTSLTTNEKYHFNEDNRGYKRDLTVKTFAAGRALGRSEAAPQQPASDTPISMPEGEYERRVKEIAPVIGMARAVSRAALSSSAEGAADARMRHDYPILQQFHTKHALGAMAAPSCLCCGQQTHPTTRPVAVRHMELPAIVICKQCKVASSAEGAATTGTLAEIRRLCGLAIDQPEKYNAAAVFTRISKMTTGKTGAAARQEKDHG